ncbi:hypothetical protein ACFWYW_46545 [Nonomuraea sp. NPDC059023]|uniref:hypothetical protein n=1 Tax=unclassified Nonomuraea TaxID=2593643 RepID=UPI0036B5114D
MFDVSGYIDGVAYHVRHDPAALDGLVVDGTSNVVALLRTFEGEEHSATPTGPTLALNLADAEAVLCALYALTEVTQVAGEAPDLFGPEVDGVVY